MDLKSKRILGISQIVISLALLLLYTRIGAIGTIYVAITMEIIAAVVTLLFGGVATSMSYKIQLCDNAQSNKNPIHILKASGLYCVLALIAAELMLFIINRVFVKPNEIMFVGTLLEFFMFILPFYVLLQYIKGIMQAVFQPQIAAFSDLIFWIVTVIGTILTYLILGDYGKKAALLMQSIKLEYFYAILCLLPGFFIGCLGSIAFLLWIGCMHREEITGLFHQNGKKKEHIAILCIKIFISQCRYIIIPVLQKFPVWILLILSIKEMKADNYLFGHLYGAVLPLLGLIWNFFDIALISYKKRLYTLYRKGMSEQYYKDIKTVLSFVFIHSVFFLVCIFSLHKSYLAIWSMQTSGEFMGLMKTSALVALLGFPYKVLIDLLKEKNAQGECTIAVFFGTVMSVVTAAICNNFLGAGVTLYILSITLGLFVSDFVAAWFVSSETGLNYLSILRKCYKMLIVNVFIGVLLVMLQNFIFTAFGGLGTLVICVLFSYLILFLSIRLFRVFSKEERKLLSFVTSMKLILRISR